MFAHDERIMPLTRDLCRKMAVRGRLTLSWPKEYGGGDLWTQMVLREEMWAPLEPCGPSCVTPRSRRFRGAPPIVESIVTRRCPASRPRS